MKSLHGAGIIKRGVIITMGKIVKSLPFKLLLGVFVGILLGLVANEAVMNVVVTIK